MEKYIKYGKIKNKNQFSNIFGTTVQLIIRMKQLIEGQYQLYEKIPDSTIILTIIDAYEQMKNKQEYLDIDPFIHETKKEINYEDYDIKFKDFFFTIICLIDFSNNAEFRIGYKPIIFTSLKDKKKKTDNESYYFDIFIENNKPLSTIIENNYEFSLSATFKPNFLFFYPTNNQDQTLKINIDDQIFITKYLYTLSIIIVKRIGSEYLNHFILYVGLKAWLKIEDEEIKMMTKTEVYKEISKQTQYRIELLGYCYRPDECIISIDNENPNESKICDIDKIKTELELEKSYTNTYRPYTVPSQQNEKSINRKGKYSVDFVEFDYKTKTYRYIRTERFNLPKQRDQYLKELDQDSKSKSTKLFYESDKYFGYVGVFDASEFEVTVYSVLSTGSSIMKKPIRILFREYFDDEDGLIDEEFDAIEEFFYPGTTMKELFEQAYNNIEGHPTELYLKNKKMSSGGRYIIFDQLLTRSASLTIESIVVAGHPTIIYYKINETNRKPSTATKQQDFLNSKPSTIETKPSPSQAAKLPSSPQVYQPSSKLSTTEMKPSPPQTAKLPSSPQVYQPSSKLSTTEMKPSPPQTAKQPSSPQVNQLSSKPSTIETKLSPPPQAEKQPSSSSTHISPRLLQYDDNKIVVTRCLRSYLYDDKKPLKVKRAIIPDRTRYVGLLLNDLIMNIIKDEKSVVLAYSVEFKNDYVVKMYERNAKIKNMPPFFNIQVRPHRNRDYRICVLRRTSVFHIRHEMNEEENGFQFSIIFEPGIYDMQIFSTQVLNYLYHGENEKPLFNIQAYNPSFYYFIKNEFKLITDIKQIVHNKDKPVFVIWSSPTVFDAVAKIIQNHTEYVTIEIQT